MQFYVPSLPDLRRHTFASWLWRPQIQSVIPVVNDAPVAQSEHERLNAYLAEVFADNLARQPFGKFLVLKIAR